MHRVAGMRYTCMHCTARLLHAFYWLILYCTTAHAHACTVLHACMLMFCMHCATLYCTALYYHCMKFRHYTTILYCTNYLMRITHCTACVYAAYSCVHCNAC